MSNVYFAELDKDYNIISVVSTPENLSYLNNFFTPNVGESKVLNYAYPNVIFKETTWKHYPDNGILVGGEVTYNWDSVESKWTDGTKHYSWVTGIGTFGDGRYSDGAWTSS